MLKIEFMSELEILGQNEIMLEIDMHNYSATNTVRSPTARESTS